MLCLRRILVIGLSTMLLLSAVSVSFAQKDAGAKARGEHSVPFWSSRYSSRRISHARDYARDFHGYVLANPKPDPAIVKEATGEIGRNLEEARKHLASMKKVYAADQATVAGIESIDKQLSAAFTKHVALCECCEKQSFDAMKTLECCEDLVAELDKILSEHEALMRKVARKAGPVTP